MMVNESEIVVHETADVNFSGLLCSVKGSTMQEQLTMPAAMQATIHLGIFWCHW